MVPCQIKHKGKWNLYLKIFYSLPGIFCKCKILFDQQCLFFLFSSISKCVLRCILTTRIARRPLSLPIADQGKDMCRSGFSQSQDSVGRQRNRRVTWDGSGPLCLPPCSPKVESSAERTFRLSESVSFTFLSSAPSSRRDRNNSPWLTREPLTPQLSLLFMPESARFVGTPRRPLPDAATRATKIDPRLRKHFITTCHITHAYECENAHSSCIQLTKWRPAP